MKLQATKKHDISFPFKLYWRQLFSSHQYVKFIDPFSFWHRYKIDHLETCWELNPVLFLERCYRLDCQPKRQVTVPTSNFTTRGMYRGVPWEKTPQNTVLISQPSWQLKYRGVTYHVNGIFKLNTNKITSDSSQNSANNSEKLFTSN
ncbi:DUF4278 domain-containing protein [Myxosarcina sp. GI1]|uniref:DUF4278 domain-containing protein n=1 Tax=Myxosarcina sp. GI1 TaxID=1541065 RepID=UPI00055B3D24|nr:DUF4278 domain-containing protein [Myxosarcina sp. GI1]